MLHSPILLLVSLLGCATTVFSLISKHKLMDVRERYIQTAFSSLTFKCQRGSLWRPSLNLSTLLASIGLLLAEPNPDDGLMGEITSEYKHDRSSFDRKGRKWTKLYAGEDQVATEILTDNGLYAVLAEFN